MDTNLIKEIFKISESLDTISKNLDTITEPDNTDLLSLGRNSTLKVKLINPLEEKENLLNFEASRIVKLKGRLLLISGLIAIAYVFFGLKINKIPFLGLEFTDSGNNFSTILFFILIFQLLGFFLFYLFDVQVIWAKNIALKIENKDEISDMKKTKAILNRNSILNILLQFAHDALNYSGPYISEEDYNNREREHVQKYNSVYNILKKRIETDEKKFIYNNSIEPTKWIAGRLHSEIRRVITTFVPENEKDIDFVYERIQSETDYLLNGGKRELTLKLQEVQNNQKKVGTEIYYKYLIFIFYYGAYPVSIGVFSLVILIINNHVNIKYIGIIISDNNIIPAVTISIGVILSFVFVINEMLKNKDLS